YDNFSAGGPYLWLNTGTSAGNPATVVQFDIATHTATGVSFQAAVSEIAGGCFIQEDIVYGTATIGVMAQGERVYGYELCSTESWLTLSNASGAITTGGTHDVTLNFDATEWTHLKADYVKTATLIFKDEHGNEYSNLVNVTMTVQNAVSIDDNLITTTDLYQNYPNPFNPSTMINFTLENDAVVSLNIYNMTGQIVATLVNSSYAKGTHTVNFNAEGLTSGIYYYTLKADDMNITKKMLLVK
ncbi:MAG: T9SS type A sorting domain-containing protein, partial [Candidatus Delongbacteria bacterium]|nr:T9SS type A sorting domain-containing protein [Candidatus Delongbacteria bacterium]